MLYDLGRSVSITIVNGRDTVKFDMTKGNKETDNEFNSRVMKNLSHFFPFMEMKFMK